MTFELDEVENTGFKVEWINLSDVYPLITEPLSNIVFVTDGDPSPSLGLTTVTVHKVRNSIGKQCVMDMMIEGMLSSLG